MNGKKDRMITETGWVLGKHTVGVGAASGCGM